MKTCKVCGAQLMVLEARNKTKPLRCSDSCKENRKSLAQREPEDD